MHRLSILIVGWWLLSPVMAAADEPKPAAEEPKPAAEELKAAADELKAAADELKSAADKLKAAADEAKQEREFACVDLEKEINSMLIEAKFLTIEQGERIFDRIPFRISKGVIQLGSTQLPDWPERVDDVQVGQRFARLHILHATGWSARDGLLIAEYVVRYEDQATEAIPVVYGDDVLDWCVRPGDKAPTRSRVVWTGDSHEAGQYGARARLYLSTWKNPAPEKRVVSIDYVGRNFGISAAPFCVAMTLEE